MTARYGFTGVSRTPMAPRQLKAVRRLLYNFPQPCELHLGDCVNADAQAFMEAVDLGIRTVGHPPLNPARRAFCTYDEERAPLDYLARNREIVREAVDGLVAAPAGWTETQRSGTWATVRYARIFKRRIWVVRPDGKIQHEGEPT